MCDCLHQVGFSKARIPINEERIVDLTRRLTDRMGGGGSELVGLPDNEQIKGISVA
jgi:hypothetical protein